MSAQNAAQEGRYDYWVNRKKAEDRARVLKAVQDDPAVLDDIPEFAEMKRILPALQTELTLKSQEAAIAEKVNADYAVQYQARQQTDITSDMMLKNRLNELTNKAGSITGAQKLANRSRPLPFAFQVFAVLAGVLTLGVFLSIYNNTTFGMAMSAAPYGLPNWVFLVVLAVVVSLYLRARGRRR